MILCNYDCIPCCDFCIHVIHDEWDDDNGHHIVSEPIGCKLHSDQKHQELAEGCSYCDDFHCFRA